MRDMEQITSTHLVNAPGSVIARVQAGTRIELVRGRGRTPVARLIAVHVDDAQQAAYRQVPVLEEENLALRQMVRSLLARVTGTRPVFEIAMGDGGAPGLPIAEIEGLVDRALSDTATRRS
jgi:hypothetical protein